MEGVDIPYYTDFSPKSKRKDENQRANDSSGRSSRPRSSSSSRWQWYPSAAAWWTWRVKGRVTEPGHAGEKDGVLPADRAGPVPLEAVQVLRHGPVEVREGGGIGGVQAVHIVGVRVQHRVLRVHQVVVPQPSLPVIGHAELLVPVDGGGHRPGEGGVEAQAVSPHIPEQRGDGQGDGEAVAAVQLQKVFKDRPPGPGLQIDGSKHGGRLLSSGMVPLHSAYHKPRPLSKRQKCEKITGIRTLYRKDRR